MSLAIINLYFGKLPNYFPMWLASCRYNPSVDFLLFTDGNIEYDPPPNVHVIKTSWEDMLYRINSKFPFDVKITSPYKLTDFKPAYGYIFEDMLLPYDYWGYCDIDLIFGDIMKFVDPCMREGKEKIYRLGHLTLYKNTESMRTLFMQEGARFSYSTVFSNAEFYSFDEHCGQMLIARKQKIDEYYAEDMADISCRVKRLTASRQVNYGYQVFYYEDGKVYRAYLLEDGVHTQEYIYIHIQKRKFEFEKVYNRFFILSNRFMEKEKGIPSAREIMELSEGYNYDDDMRQLRDYKQKKRREFLLCSLKMKWIWLNQKIAEGSF